MGVTSSRVCTKKDFFLLPLDLFISLLHTSHEASAERGAGSVDLLDVTPFR
jgi:hypothetical protein